MARNAHFSVNTRLARILGETYRSSEVALKELVDNAWDADATAVYITLPEPVTGGVVVMHDNGSGMTANEMRHEYLNIASDKRSRTGDRTPKLHRKVKGRKGIGKFAGLTIAGKMEVQSVARGIRSQILIDKLKIIENQNDLESIPLPFSEEQDNASAVGTSIILSELDNRLNFPVAERLREILIYEYGREDSFKVFVNDIILSIQDVPGKSFELKDNLRRSGVVNLRFTVADNKRLPRYPGIILRIDGKTVGGPNLFGLDEDEEIPIKLLRRLFGEVDVSGSEDFVTADWGGVLENSKSYQEIKQYISEKIKEALKEAHARELAAQKARLEKQVRKRLEKIPEFRRKFAEEALYRILKRFYYETHDRIEIIADVALDAMEHDAYWSVLESINASSDGDVAVFAQSLENFGILELSTIGAQAARRLELLDFFDKLINKEDTDEKTVHKAFESNAWILGRSYSTMASNVTLRTIVENYCEKKYKGNRSSKRPDLLLAQDYGDRFLLIEFKRPSHDIGRDDVAQAQKYWDDISPYLPSMLKVDIIVVGRGKLKTMNDNYMTNNIKVQSYFGIISEARSQLNWLIESLKYK